MATMPLKDRIEPYFSIKVFGLTLAVLIGFMLVAVGALSLTSSAQHEVDASVTLPLKDDEEAAAAVPEGENAPEQAVTPGQLNPADMAVTEPAPVDTSTAHTQPAPATAASEQPTSAPALPTVAEAKPRPQIEDAVAGLHESTPFGMVPVVRKSDSLTAYKAYKVDYTPAPTARAIISLVMVDYGLSQSASEKAIANLPEGVTFSLSAYSKDAQKLTTAARQGGHEVWLSVPIQHQGYGTDDTGSQSILVNASIEQNKARLLTSLGKATGYAGVIDMDSPAFEDSAADLEGIYSMITDRGLALAQGNPKDTLTGSFAASHKTPFIQNDIWIDASTDPAQVVRELDKLRQIALNGNIAVGFFHPYPAVINAIKTWSLQLATDSIELAPLSTAIEQKNSSRP